MRWRSLTSITQILTIFTITFITQTYGLSYRCENDQILIVQSFGNDTIRMHCQKLQLCGYSDLKCNYEREQPACGGKTNFVSHVNQLTPTGKVSHTCCDMTFKNDKNKHIIEHDGNDCFVYELPDGTSDTTPGSEAADIIKKNFEVVTNGFSVLKNASQIPEDFGGYTGYRLRLFMLRNKSPPLLIVKAIERTSGGYRVTICRPRCGNKYNREGSISHGESISTYEKDYAIPKNRQSSSESGSTVHIEEENQTTKIESKNLKESSIEEGGTVSREYENKSSLKVDITQSSSESLTSSKISSDSLKSKENAKGDGTMTSGSSSSGPRSGSSSSVKKNGEWTAATWTSWSSNTWTTWSSQTWNKWNNSEKDLTKTAETRIRGKTRGDRVSSVDIDKHIIEEVTKDLKSKGTDINDYDNLHSHETHEIESQEKGFIDNRKVVIINHNSTTYNNYVHSNGEKSNSIGGQGIPSQIINNNSFGNIGSSSNNAAKNKLPNSISQVNNNGEGDSQSNENEKKEYKTSDEDNVETLTSKKPKVDSDSSSKQEKRKNKKDKGDKDNKNDDGKDLSDKNRSPKKKPSGNGSGKKSGENDRDSSDGGNNNEGNGLDRSNEEKKGDNSREGNDKSNRGKEKGSKKVDQKKNDKDEKKSDDGDDVKDTSDTSNKREKNKKNNEKSKDNIKKNNIIEDGDENTSGKHIKTTSLPKHPENEGDEITSDDGNKNLKNENLSNSEEPDNKNNSEEDNGQSGEDDGQSEEKDNDNNENEESEEDDDNNDNKSNKQNEKDFNEKTTEDLDNNSNENNGSEKSIKDGDLLSKGNTTSDKNTLGDKSKNNRKGGSERPDEGDLKSLTTVIDSDGGDENINGDKNITNPTIAIDESDKDKTNDKKINGALSGSESLKNSGKEVSTTDFTATEGDTNAIDSFNKPTEKSVESESEITSFKTEKSGEDNSNTAPRTNDSEENPDSVEELHPGKSESLENNGHTLKHGKNKNPLRNSGGAKHEKSNKKVDDDDDGDGGDDTDNGGNGDSERSPPAPGDDPDVKSKSTPLRQSTNAKAASAPTQNAAGSGGSSDPPGAFNAVAKRNCFAADTIIETPGGQKRMDELQVGDLVLVPSAEGIQKFEKIEMFYHRKPDYEQKFLSIQTRSGKKLSLTELHLIPFGECEKALNAIQSSENLQQWMLGSRYAYKVKEGQCVISYDENNHLIADKIIKVGRKISKGIYSPITTEGAIVTDGIFTSCFSQIESQATQKLAYDIITMFYRAFGYLSDNTQQIIQEIPSSVDMLHHLSWYIIPFAKY
uniref:ZP domain-containing protein n=1 Tax=Parastrongyloides trichosuri TaxID=131310 RepID=A0A0N5A363_PARTI